MSKIIIYLATFILPCCFLQAQNPFIRHYTTDDGLPSDNIMIIYPDSERFLWIATEGGLVRYDGSSFRHFSNKDGLIHNKVLVIKEDSFHRTWLFCIGSQLNYFYQNKIYNKQEKPFLDSLRLNWTFVQDGQGNLYFYAYHSRRICVLDMNNHVKYYWLPSEPLKDNSISSDGMNIQYLVKIPTGEFLIWTYSGLYKTNDLSQKPVKVRNFDRYHNILTISDSVIYEAIAFPESNYSQLTRYSNGIPSDTIIFNEGALDVDARILEGPNGDLWISSPNLGIYCLRNKKVIYHVALMGIFWMCQDIEDNIWGISSSGAYKISPYALLFKHFDNSFFEGRSIGALSADPQGTIWGYGDNAIFLFQDNKFYTRDLSNLYKGFQDLDALDNHSMIIYNYDIITSAAFAITGISINPEDSHLVYQQAIPFKWDFSMAEPVFNRNKDIIAIYDVNDQQVITYSVDKQFQEIDRVPIGNASHVFYDSKDNLVVLEYKGDSVLYNKQKRPYREFASLPRALPTDHEILDTFADVFLSMYDSLYLVKDRQACNLTSSFDYSFNTPIQRLTYKDPTLYISTIRNLFTCDNLKKFTNDKTIPLRLIDINFSSISDIQAANDTLYVASSDGLTLIPVDLIDSIATRPPLPYFQHVKINDAEADIYIGSLTVRGRNKLSFEFGNINFSQNPALYSYKLEGYEENWNEGTGKSVVYAGLPAGDYRMLLRASKSNSPWSVPIGYNITVRATFWQHPLFYVFLSLLFAGLISLLVVYRKNSQMKKREMEHQLVTLEQKALQSMMNPHFLFNALGSIQNYLLQNKSGEAGLYLSQFARLIRQNIQGIHSAFITLEAETDRLKNYLDLEKMRMGNRLDYRFSVDESIEEDEVMIPTMVIQPFVENAILHGISPLEKGGLITLDFVMKSENTLKIAIEDNGIGVKQSQAFKSSSRGHLHMSMEMTAKRIEILGKKFRVKTSLTVSDAYPGNPNPGTRVEIVLPVSYGADK